MSTKRFTWQVLLQYAFFLHKLQRSNGPCSSAPHGPNAHVVDGIDIHSFRPFTQICLMRNSSVQSILGRLCYLEQPFSNSLRKSMLV
jgi:hypothetical protein